jgi:hypothetical protein
MKRGWLIRGFAALAGLAVLLALWLALKTPRQDREWQKDMAGLARVSDENGTLMIEPYRDWSWSGDGATAERWVQSPPFKIGDVRGAWLVVEPHPSMKIMAHTLVIFDFSGGALIGLSVEARKEKDETYSAFKGAFREYELS